MEIEFSPKQIDIITRPFDVTLEVNEGTPRSGKTTAGVFRYAYYLGITPDKSHLVTGYNQEQAYRLFMECDGLGLKHIFSGMSQEKSDRHGDYLEIHTPAAVKKVYYKGGGKADSHKAITGMSLGSVVFCEINLLHMDMIQECFRRTFAAKMRYHLADLNPPPPQHPVIKEVFDVQKTRWQHWTIRDNPIISDARKQEIYETLSKSPYLLARDWEGKRVIPEGVIYSVFDMNENICEQLEGVPVEMYFAGDGGQNDATSVSCNIVTRMRTKGAEAAKREYTYNLYRVANYYHSGSETGQTKAMSTYALEIKEFIQWAVDKFEMRYTDIFIDPACKSLREELNLLGLPARRADNNAKDIKGTIKGIEVGIERAQNLISSRRVKIVNVSEKYGHYYILRDFGMYCRQENGKPIDEYNDTLDEFRYAVNYFYRNYVI